MYIIFTIYVFSEQRDQTTIKMNDLGSRFQSEDKVVPVFPVSPKVMWISVVCSATWKDVNALDFLCSGTFSCPLSMVSSESILISVVPAGTKGYIDFHAATGDCNEVCVHWFSWRLCGCLWSIQPQETMWKSIFCASTGCYGRKPSVVIPLITPDS